MGFLVIGDPHLDSKTPLSRMDDYRLTTINKLRQLLLLAKKKKATAVISTGDMFHRFDIPISYLNEVMQVLQMFRAAGIDFYSIIGNHDIPHNNMIYFRNSPLSLLFKSELVKELGVGKNSLPIDDVIVFGLSFTKALEDLKGFTTTSRKKILVMHYGTENTVPTDNVPMGDLQEFDIVFSGHDHMYYEPFTKGKTTVYRPGSFTRRTKDTYNLERNIVVYHYDDTGEVEELLLAKVDPAVNIFKEQAFTRDVDNLYTNSYSKLFLELSEDREYTSVFEILEDLPPDVAKESVDSIIEYLKSEGIVPKVRVSKKAEEDFVDQFSE